MVGFCVSRGRPYADRGVLMIVFCDDDDDDDDKNGLTTTSQLP